MVRGRHDAEPLVEALLLEAWPMMALFIAGADLVLLLHFLEGNGASSGRRGPITVRLRKRTR